MASRSGHAVLRIAGGQFGGRKILPPPGAGTRPMTGYAKKSLFGMLQERLDGAAVCDLYCGTGTLGFEALSRGARCCAFAERDRRVIERLQRNIEICGVAAAATVWPGNVETRLAGWLAAWDRPVDIAFLDPPFPAVRRWRWDTLAERLFAPLAERLAGDGIVMLRTPDDVVPPDVLAGLTASRTKTYGQMTVTLYGRAT